MTWCGARALLAAAVVAVRGIVRADARQAPTLALVLDRAGQYALDYEGRFSLLVAEERYEQRAERPVTLGAVAPRSRSNPGGTLIAGNERARSLRSDYLLVHADEGGWLPFRDVFEVDGRKLRDREDRMVKLLLKPGASSMEKAQQIMAESTRYNLGRITRTINIPTLAVLLVQPDLQPRLLFSNGGEEMVGSRPAVRVTYEEHQRPTLVRTTNGRDLPMSGSLWIDPADGTVLKTEMAVADSTVRAVVTVTFREDAAVGLWVPAAMTEYYKATMSADEIRCTATYSNYRKFSVSTDELIESPPGTKPKPPPG